MRPSCDANGQASVQASVRSLGSRDSILYSRYVETFAEYERKLDAPAGFELPAFEGEPLESRVFTSYYFDTEDYSLARSRIMLRRRVERGTSTWQLKLPRADDRLEIAVRGRADGPPAKLARLLLAHTRHATLAPVAELRTRRRGTLVETRRVSAEVTVDEVSVIGAQRADRFVEVEVEVRSGDRKDVDRIVRELERAGATTGSGRAKLLRALDLPAPGEVDASHGAFALLRSRLGEQLIEILAHDPGTRLGTDAESLHDMRVAFRRSRALLRAGTKLLAADTRPFQAELKWVGEVLGAVRDLDVMLEHLAEQARTLDAGDAEAAEALLGRLASERDVAQEALLDALESERYFTLLDRFEALVAQLEPAAGASSLDSLVDKQLSRLRRAVRGLGDEPADPELHEVRKRGKRARYTTELAGNDEVVKQLKELQDVLGEHQDAVVAADKLHALARDPGTTVPEALAAGRLIEREHERKARARAEWPGRWQPLERHG